jgi:septal ring factor EnvC (AmiA/AmiB activator)
MPLRRSFAVTALCGAFALAANAVVFAQADTAPPDLTLRPAVTDAPASADPASDPVAMAQPTEQLANIQLSLRISKERGQQLKQEIANMKGDRDKQNAALIAANQRVRMAEADIAALEERIGDLIVQELEVRGRLDGADANISNVLAALERISRNPPPALIVNPTDALGSARSALLISALLPNLRARANAVLEDLQQLSDIKAEALAEQEKLEANLNILSEEQLRIAVLLAARKESESRASAALADEEQQAEALAARADSLQALITELSKRAASASESATAANSGQPLDRSAIAVALADPTRTTPAAPFSRIKGFLTLPASGVAVIDYGAGDGFGGISRGVSIVTGTEAQVIAPADGWVLYRGKYLDYGEIVILNAGDDYTVLLAGLDQVTVSVGQFVRMGETVGTMGSRTSGRTIATGAGVSRPTLYIEMRKDNKPVDPTGWWATPPTPTQSG